MNSLKMKLLDEIIDHMNCSQGKDFKSMLDESKKPEMPPGGKESEMEDMGEKPKGIAVEKVSVMGKPDQEIEGMIKKKTAGMGDEMPEGSEGKPEMSEEELKELLEQYMS